MKLTNKHGNITFEINDPREQERLEGLGYKEIKEKPKGEEKPKGAGKAK